MDERWVKPGHNPKTQKAWNLMTEDMTGLRCFGLGPVSGLRPKTGLRKPDQTRKPKIKNLEFQDRRPDRFRVWSGSHVVFRSGPGFRT